MQVIEDCKKCILRFFCTIEELHIINDEHIYQLVEMDEIIDGIIAAMIYKLVDELLRTYIQDSFVRVQPAHLVAYCLHQVGFTPAYSTKHYQGIERSSSGLLRHVHTC